MGQMSLPLTASYSAIGAAPMYASTRWGAYSGAILGSSFRAPVYANGVALAGPAYSSVVTPAYGYAGAPFTSVVARSYAAPVIASSVLAPTCHSYAPMVSSGLIL